MELVALTLALLLWAVVGLLYITSPNRTDNRTGGE